MQSGRIRNSAIKASSQWDNNHAAYLGRLKRLRRGKLMGAWSARHNNYNQWIQVDLGKSMKVTGVATQGREETSQWVTAFYVLYSSDGVKFAKVKDWWDVIKVSIVKGICFFLRDSPSEQAEKEVRSKLVCLSVPEFCLVNISVYVCSLMNVIFFFQICFKVIWVDLF